MAGGQEGRGERPVCLDFMFREEERLDKKERRKKVVGIGAQGRETTTKAVKKRMGKRSDDIKYI